MRFSALIVAAALALAGCSGSNTDRPGSPAVYDRIESTSDCAQLQQEFDTASTNHDRAEAGSEQAEAATSYMQAAQDRMEEVGC